MMYKKVNPSYILIVLIGMFGMACSTNNNENTDSTIISEEDSFEQEISEECTFDVKTQTSEFLQGIEEFENHVWVDSIKTAIILLENGDSLHIKRGGCSHFEVSVTLLTNEQVNVNDTIYWLDKAIWFADRVYSDYDKELLKSIIANREYQINNQEAGLQIIFEGGHGFSEFYESITPFSDKIKMELVYYFD